eukprot:4330227-Pyramimonas_sp.AAC.1
MSTGWSARPLAQPALLSGFACRSPPLSFSQARCARPGCSAPELPRTSPTCDGPMSHNHYQR